jgi:hypothetical protein
MRIIVKTVFGYRKCLTLATAQLGEKLLYKSQNISLSMHEYLSESEWERIVEFAKTPVYKRSPEQLLPDSDAEVDD